MCLLAHKTVVIVDDIVNQKCGVPFLINISAELLFPRNIFKCSNDGFKFNALFFTDNIKRTVSSAAKIDAMRLKYACCVIIFTNDVFCFEMGGANSFCDCICIGLKVFFDKYDVV
jgi:hypothetical protein